MSSFKRSSTSSPNKEKAKKPRCNYSCKFIKGWLKKFDFIQPTSNDNTAYCTYRKLEYSIAAGGTNDITRHNKTSKHTEHSKGLENTASLDSYMAVGNSKIDKVRVPILNLTKNYIHDTAM